MTNHGGKRIGAGRKSNWQTTTTGTTTIRIPKSLAEALSAAKSTLDIDELVKQIKLQQIIDLTIDETRCQCLTVSGKRCTGSAAYPVDKTIDVQRYKFMACSRHKSSYLFKPCKSVLNLT